MDAEPDQFPTRGIIFRMFSVFCSLGWYTCWHVPTTINGELSRKVIKGSCFCLLVTSPSHVQVIELWQSFQDLYFDNKDTLGGYRWNWICIWLTPNHDLMAAWNCIPKLIALHVKAKAGHVLKKMHDFSQHKITNESPVFKLIVWKEMSS